MPKTRRLPDATLVRRSQQGDRRAFAVLTARYDWRLRGLAHALLLDRAEMDTALGIAYVRAWRDIVRISVKDDVGAWLYRVTYNACIDQLRRAGGGDGAAAPQTGMAAGLASLSASDRVVVVLVDREGFTPVSAARILGLSPSTVSARLEVARRRLAEYVPLPPAAVASLGSDDVQAETADGPPPEPDIPEPEVEPDVEAPPALEAQGAPESGAPAAPGPVPVEPAEPEPAAESGVPVEPSPDPVAESGAVAEPVSPADVPGAGGRRRRPRAAPEPVPSAAPELAAESGVPVEPSPDPVDVPVVAAEPVASAEPDSAEAEPAAEPEPAAQPASAEPEPEAEPEPVDVPVVAAEPVASAEPASAEAEPTAAPEPVDVRVVAAEPVASAEPASAEAEPTAAPDPAEPASAEPEPEAEPEPVDESLAAAEPAASGDAEPADRDSPADVGGSNGSGAEAPVDADPESARQGNGVHPNGHASAPAANGEVPDDDRPPAADDETGHGDNKGRGRRARRRARYAASHRSSDRPRPAGDDGP